MFAKYEKLQPGEKKRIVGATVPYGRVARPAEMADWQRSSPAKTLTTSLRKHTISTAATG
jgi:hypothetical protein